MNQLFSSDTGWLNLTNALLGLAVIVCIVAVGRVIIQDLRLRMAHRARRPLEYDDHAFSLSSLGITMADGGEPIDETSPTHRKAQEGDDVPPNIVRSDN